MIYVFMTTKFCRRPLIKETLLFPSTSLTHVISVKTGWDLRTRAYSEPAFSWNPKDTLRGHYTIWGPICWFSRVNLKPEAARSVLHMMPQRLTIIGK